MLCLCGMNQAGSRLCKKVANEPLGLKWGQGLEERVDLAITGARCKRSNEHANMLLHIADTGMLMLVLVLVGHADLDAVVQVLVQVLVNQTEVREACAELATVCGCLDGCFCQLLLAERRLALLCAAHKQKLPGANPGGGCGAAPVKHGACLCLCLCLFVFVLVLVLSCWRCACSSFRSKTGCGGVW